MVQGLKTAVIEGHDIGGTCVNRGCVPSKALLAASGRVRELQNEMHLKAMGIQVQRSSVDSLSDTALMSAAQDSRIVHGWLAQRSLPVPWQARCLHQSRWLTHTMS